MIAWAPGTTGTADVCAPSWMPRAKRDTDYLNAWLAEGYAVVASDHQGLGTPGGHPWMAVRPEGWSVLDGVRSALAAFPELANAVVIVGPSQGAHAALSAAGLAAADYPGQDHGAAVNASLVDSVPFVRKLLAGQAVAGTCPTLTGPPIGELTHPRTVTAPCPSPV